MLHREEILSTKTCSAHFLSNSPLFLCSDSPGLLPNIHSPPGLTDSPSGTLMETQEIFVQNITSFGREVSATDVGEAFLEFHQASCCESMLSEIGEAIRNSAPALRERRKHFSERNPLGVTRSFVAISFGLFSPLRVLSLPFF